MLNLLISILCVAIVTAIPIHFDERPIIATDSGLVQGVRTSSGIFSYYYGFKGIPYAEPPVGDLRFRAPLPHRGWEGVRDASKHGSICATGTETGYIGDEDCLFLNVYTPNLIGRRPVMFWIHGGSFTTGSGNSDQYGPDFLVNDDVVVVTFNYRLGSLGFLSTGDKYSPGNYGLKDAIQALKWVQKNILAFGGDPDNVTVFGQSSGGASVHYLILSPLSKGLFHKAISQSGSALSPWAFATDPQKWASHAATVLGIEAATTEELITELRQASVLDLVRVNQAWTQLEIPRGLRPFPYVPSVDPVDSEEPIFLPKSPRELMESGEFNDVPYMSGQNDHESQFMLFESSMDPNTIPTLNANPHYMIPQEWNITPGTPEATEIVNVFRSLYLNGEELSEYNLFDWTIYLTDHQFTYGIDQTVKLHSKNHASSVFHYMFTAVDDLNLAKAELNLNAYPGAIHGDELGYLFNSDAAPSLIEPSTALTTRARIVRLWTNFAKTGNPTYVLDHHVHVEWPKVTSADEYLNIGENLIPGQSVFGDRMSVWYSLQERFAQ